MRRDWRTKENGTHWVIAQGNPMRVMMNVAPAGLLVRLRKKCEAHLNLLLQASWESRLTRCQTCKAQKIGGTGPTKSLNAFYVPTIASAV
jgi:hypothetical protein